MHCAIERIEKYYEKKNLGPANIKETSSSCVHVRKCDVKASDKIVGGKYSLCVNEVSE